MTSNPSSHGVFRNWNITNNDLSDNTQYCVIHGHCNHSTKECHAFPKKDKVVVKEDSLKRKWTVGHDDELELLALDSDEYTKETKEFEMLQKKFQNLDSCIDDSREPELCSIADIIKGRHRKKQKEEEK